MVHAAALDIVGYTRKSGEVQKQIIQQLNHLAKKAISGIRGQGDERVRDIDGTWHWHLYGCAADFSIRATHSELRVIFHDRIRTQQHIPLRATTPNYGGIRWWFLCPRCSRRVSLLYKPSNLQWFLCRYCYELTYESVQTSGTKVSKFFKATAKELHTTTREARQWIRLNASPSYVHEVKRPVPNNVRERRTGFALQLTKQARSKGLNL